MLAGGAAGAIVVVNKILSNYEKQWQTSSSKGFVHEARKKEIHFENIINECNQLCQRMASQMMNRLQDLLDDNYLIDNLKSKREDSNPLDKLEIWKALRANVLTRLLSELYCTCILVCYMRVQMSVVGGQVYVKSINPSTQSASGDLSHMKAYTKYNALLGSFYEQRFDCLIHPLEEIVDHAVCGYNMNHNISIQDFKVILDKIKSEFTKFLTNPESKTKVLFLDAERLSNVDLASVCPDSGCLNEQDEQMLRNMLAETQDILESEDFKLALESSIDVGYTVLLDSLLGAFIKIESKLNSKKDSPSSGFSNPNAIKVPFVKILPQIRNSYTKRSESEQKALVNHLLCLDVLNCFAANVYEAFCVPK